MHHESAKSMLFYFLSGRNYNQDSGQLNFEMGYDLGDYSPGDKRFYEIARKCAQLLRVELAGVFDEKGNIVSGEIKDNFGVFHKDSGNQ